MKGKHDMNTTPKPSFWARCAGITPRDRRNQLWASVAIIAWALIYSTSLTLINKEIVPDGPISWILAALPTLAGLLVILAYIRFIRQADELQRLVQLQSLALTFGVTFFAFAGYRIVELLGAPPADFDHYIVITCVLYSLVTVLAWRRYR